MAVGAKGAGALWLQGARGAKLRRWLDPFERVELSRADGVFADCVGLLAERGYAERARRVFVEGATGPASPAWFHTRKVVPCLYRLVGERGVAGLREVLEGLEEPIERELLVSRYVMGERAEWAARNLGLTLEEARAKEAHVLRHLSTRSAGWAIDQIPERRAAEVVRAVFVRGESLAEVAGRLGRSKSWARKEYLCGLETGRALMDLEVLLGGRTPEEVVAGLEVSAGRAAYEVALREARAEGAGSGALRQYARRLRWLQSRLVLAEGRETRLGGAACAKESGVVRPGPGMEGEPVWGSYDPWGRVAIGRELRLARVRRGLTPADVVRLGGPYVEDLERGRRAQRLGTVARVCRALDLGLVDWVYGEGLGGVQVSDTPVRDGLRRLGVVVRRRREALGVSGTALGASLGMSRAWVPGIERGKNTLEFEQLPGLASSLGMSPRALLRAMDGDVEPVDAWVEAVERVDLAPEVVHSVGRRVESVGDAVGARAWELSSVPEERWSREAIGLALRGAREGRGLALGDLRGPGRYCARALEVGERAQRLGTMSRVCRGLGVGLVELMYKEGTEVKVFGGTSVPDSLRRVGGVVRRTRQRLGVAREVLAKPVGKSAGWVGRIERGDDALALEEVPALCLSLGLSPRALLGVMDGEIDPADVGGLGAETDKEVRGPMADGMARRRTTTVSERLGENLRGVRKKRGLTQEEVASRLGMYQSEVSRLELGRGTMVQLAQVCALLGVSASGAMRGECELGAVPVGEGLGRARLRVGRYLRELRGEHGLTQRDVASVMGKSSSWAGRLERGETSLVVGRTLVLVERLGGCPVKCLQAWEGEQGDRGL